MPGPSPLKLLEISILSAQDLAPVSKLLRTYAVAWVHPDQKLTTRVDHQGQTNPTWNYRFVFRVDDRFLASDSSALTIEIYNVSWLRDIPIGTVRVPISSLLPPPSPPQAKSSAGHFLSLPIRRPSGPLQGTLNIGFNLIDGTLGSLPLESELSASTTASDGGDLILNIPTINWGNRNQNQEQHKGEDKKQPPSPLQNAKTVKLNRSLSERTVSDAYSYTRSKSGSVFSGRIWEGLKIGKSSKSKSKSRATSGKGSVYSYYMRPLPSEVAESMAKGLYSGSMDDVGSSVFENWTVGGDNESVYRREEEVANVLVPMPMPVRWETDDGLGKKKKKKGSDGGGLLSCFGCGFECNIICGGPKNKMKKNQKRLGEMPYNHSPENLQRLLY